MIGKETGRVECPECHELKMKCWMKHSRMGFMCRGCWSKKNRESLKETFEPLPKLPRLKPGPKRGSHRILDSILYPGKFDLIKKKRFMPLRKPIKNVEKSILWKELKRDGLSDEEIKKRIDKLEWTVKMNHAKEFERRLNENGQR